jgi:N-acetylmuramoyl-L-alanine amidase
MNWKFWQKKPKPIPPPPPPDVKQRLSPNYAKGRPGPITHIVMHNTAGPFETSLLRLMTPIAEVSAHYLMDRDGEAWQLVLDGDTAWHSGNRAMNQCSLGIEIVAYASKPGMTPVQAEAVLKLVRHLMQTYGIKRENIIPHRSVRATLCPSFIWATDQQFNDWKATL